MRQIELCINIVYIKWVFETPDTSPLGAPATDARPIICSLAVAAEKRPATSRFRERDIVALEIDDLGDAGQHHGRFHLACEVRVDAVARTLRSCGSCTGINT